MFGYVFTCLGIKISRAWMIAARSLLSPKCITQKVNFDKQPFLFCRAHAHCKPHDDVIKWKYSTRYWHFVREPPVTGTFPSQRPVMRSFDVFFDLRLNKRLSKQSRRRWFETPWRSLWRHCYGRICNFTRARDISTTCFRKQTEIHNHL